MIDTLGSLLQLTQFVNNLVRRLFSLNQKRFMSILNTMIDYLFFVLKYHFIWMSVFQCIYIFTSYYRSFESKGLLFPRYCSHSVGFLLGSNPLVGVKQKTIDVGDFPAFVDCNICNITCGFHSTTLVHF